MNPLHLLGLIAVLALLAYALVRRKPGGDSSAARTDARSGGRPRSSRTAVDTGAALTTAPAPPDAARAAPRPVMPASLREFEWKTADSLPESRREQMLAELKKTPPPPRAFYQLVSQDFVARASSAELAELVMGVPMAATKVLARANSAYYGLRRPVGSLGQAITLLGLNTVRTICLQYMMEASFKAHSPALKQRFDHLWAGSAIAGELSQKLAQRLQLPEASGLVTEVALSSLGHFAAATLMPREGDAPSNQSLLARTWAEQAQLGVPAAEIGAMLMRAWAVPDVLVEEVRAIDRMLVTPASGVDPQGDLRLAVAYLSARLGERIARGDAVNLGDFEHSVLTGDDYFHLRASLPPDPHQRLQDVLESPEIVRALHDLVEALREPGLR